MLVLEQLTVNAVQEGRFQDAGYYYWVLGQQCLENAASNKGSEDELIVAYRENEKLATIYYAYDVIQRYIVKHFTVFFEI